MILNWTFMNGLVNAMQIGIWFSLAKKNRDNI